MSNWLRDHKHHWVYPVVQELHNRVPFQTAESWKHPDWKITQSLTYEEAKKLTYYDLNVVLPLIEAEKKKPHASMKAWNDYPLVIRSCIKSLESELRDRGYSRLILTGRDTWVFVVLCEKRKIPYVYLPEFSRVVAEHANTWKILYSAGITEKDLLFDTGWQGSIQKAISVAMGWHQPFLMMSQVKQMSSYPLATNRAANRWETKRKIYPNQIYPNRGISRTEAIAVEHLPKYLKTGRMGAGGTQVLQDVMELSEFIQCFLMTEMLWMGTK